MDWVRIISVSAAFLTLVPGARAEIVSTENFIVVAPDALIAAEVLKEAEFFRKRIALAYLGEELPAGAGRTVISVELSDTEDRASFWPVDHSRRTHHRLWLTTSRQTAAGSKLAHEITHLVLEVRYGNLLPKWADEGFASMQDGRERTAIRERIVRETTFVQRWPITRVLSLTGRMSAHDQDAYAASTSFTEFLMTRGDAARTLEFAVQGMQHGWERAAHAHYGMSLAELGAAWQKWLGRRTQPLVARPRVATLSGTQKFAAGARGDEAILPVSISRVRTLR